MASMVSGIHGQLLEVTVVGCSRLKDTEWISRQDPYVCVEYGSTKYRTRTHKDGGKNPVFQEKFVFTLIEGLRDLKVVVWNSNTLSYDDFIGSGMIQLQRVLSQGFDDTPWPLQGKGGRHAGEVRLIMHYSQANQQKPVMSYGPSAPPYGASHSPHVSPYSVPPPSTASYAHPTASYPAPSPYPAYPPAPAAYPPQSTPYPPPPATYPQHPPQSTAYPPPYAPPPSAYPPTYPNPGSSYYPPPPY